MAAVPRCSSVFVVPLLILLFTLAVILEATGTGAGTGAGMGTGTVTGTVSGTGTGTGTVVGGVGAGSGGGRSKQTGGGSAASGSGRKKGGGGGGGGGAGGGGGRGTSCSAVRQTWVTQGIGNQIVPSSMISGSDLQVCTGGAPTSVSSSRGAAGGTGRAGGGGGEAQLTCCSKEMEDALVARSREQYGGGRGGRKGKKTGGGSKGVVGEKLGQLKDKFKTRATKFRGLCQGLISNSSRDLHEMFTKTYGVLYQQNSQVFADLFRDLHSFYNLRGGAGSRGGRGGKVKGGVAGTPDLDLNDVLNKFFSNLLQKMFVLLNTHYTFDAQYLQCIGQHVDDLKPFGDVPQKLIVHLKRAFIAARTFLQGLIAAQDLIMTINNVDVSSVCQDAITRLVYCPYCSGLVNIKPCHGYCLNVMNACLAYHNELADTWNTYLDLMLKVADRLEGSFNIESVLDPIDVKISDAIMNFQENSEAVTSKIFQSCGQPTLGSRTKRHKSSIEPSSSRRGDSTAAATADSRRGSQQKYARPTAASAGTPLIRVLRDVREVLTSSKDFWNNLPRNSCDIISSSEMKDSEESCWTGRARGRYTKPLVGYGLANQTDNPEVTIDTRRSSSAVVNRQISKIKLISTKLRNAHAGLDVELTDALDDDEDYEDGSGAGRYDEDADEDDEDEEEDDDDDDEDDDYAYIRRTIPPTARPRPHSAINPGRSKLRDDNDNVFNKYTNPPLPPHRPAQHTRGAYDYIVTRRPAQSNPTAALPQSELYGGSSGGRVTRKGYGGATSGAPASLSLLFLNLSMLTVLSTSAAVLFVYCRNYRLAGL